MGRGGEEKVRHERKRRRSAEGRGGAMVRPGPRKALAARCGSSRLHTDRRVRPSAPRTSLAVVSPLTFGAPLCLGSWPEGPRRQRPLVCTSPTSRTTRRLSGLKPRPPRPKSGRQRNRGPSLPGAPARGNSEPEQTSCCRVVVVPLLRWSSAFSTSQPRLPRRTGGTRDLRRGCANRHPIPHRRRKGQPHQPTLFAD